MKVSSWHCPCACLLMAAAGPACSGNQSMFNPQGPAARSIAGFGWLLIGISLAVWLVVVAALVWALMRARASPDDRAGSGRMATVVAGGVGLTAIVLVALTSASAAVGRGLTSPSGPAAITIDVIGHQWWWDFQYRDATPSNFATSPNELRVPTGVRVVLNAQSRDVIHSFWAPNLHGKRDLVPGLNTAIWLQADRPGTYRGQCAEFCGFQHAKMAFSVVAEPMEAFQKWIRQQRQPAVEPSTDDERRGRELFLTSTCVTCHTIRGTEAGSRVGPDLTHVAGRLTLAAGTLPNTSAHLRQWIANPQSIKPGVRMPASSLSSADLDALVAYLRSLR